MGPTIHEFLLGGAALLQANSWMVVPDLEPMGTTMTVKRVDES